MEEGVIMGTDRHRELEPPGGAEGKVREVAVPCHQRRHTLPHAVLSAPIHAISHLCASQVLGELTAGV
eukprot:31283-Rhodomonas_salina.1